MSQIRTRLARAQEYADRHSGCQKVKVGAYIACPDGSFISGANRVVRGLPTPCEGVESCQVNGHCVSTIHAEIDAIICSIPLTVMRGGTIYVTRYPCEACARAIVKAGIANVVYGRPQPISEMTARIFQSAGVDVLHVEDFEG